MLTTESNLMIRITLDPDLANKLQELRQRLTNSDPAGAELCDSSGQVLGRFVPIVDMTAWIPLTPDVSEEELDRREKSNEWYTTDEVLAHLEKLRCSESGGNEKP
jgi:hypothetical protein